MILYRLTTFNGNAINRRDPFYTGEKDREKEKQPFLFQEVTISKALVVLYLAQQ